MASRKKNLSPKDIEQIFEWVTAAVSLLGDILSKEGETVIQGRRIAYIIRPKVKGFTLKWYSKVTDLQSGIEDRADNYKKDKGALEHALANLVTSLKREEIIP